MLWLKRVIARLLGTQTQPLDNPVQPTQTVGLVSKELTTPVGNKRSAQTFTRQRQSVTPKSSSKRKAAQSTSAESSRKAEPKSAPKTSGANGKQRKTPVRQTPQHAKPKAKLKP
jgi:hypothetical protein